MLSRAASPPPPAPRSPARHATQGRVWFEGGQSPLIKRIPKHGFSRAALKKPLQELDLSALARFVRAGRVDASQPVTLRALHESGVVGRFRHGVKLLGADALEGLPPLRLEVSGASRAAREAVERAGGEVRLVYFNRLGLRAHTKPHKFDMMPKRARVPPRLRDRGLAVPTIEEQIEEAARLGKVLNPPYNYREAPAARK